MKVLFIINPKSGKRDGPGLEALISEESRKQGFEFLIHRLHSDDKEEDIKYEIDAYAPDIVAGAGGDGTINFLAKLLKNTNIPLLIIPLGSANGMAKELGIGNRMDVAFGLITKGFTKSIDILNINGQWCIHLADVGLNARIVKRFENDSKRGLWTYARHLFSEIFLIKKYTFHINADGSNFSRKAVSLTFANASKYGTGAVINPVGKLNDGKFELVIIKPFPRIKLISIAIKMFLGTLQTSEYVEVISCSEALIRTSRSTTLQIDGEVCGKVKEIKIHILQESLRVIIPENL